MTRHVPIQEPKGNVSYGPAKGHKVTKYTQKSQAPQQKKGVSQELVIISYDGEADFGLSMAAIGQAHQVRSLYCARGFWLCSL